MKRSIVLTTILAALAGTASAEDIVLTGGDIVYTGQSVTATSKDKVVKGGALSSEGAVSISGASGVSFCSNSAVNSYSSSHTTADKDLAAGGAIYGGSVIISGNSGEILFDGNELRAKTSNDYRNRVRGGAIKGGTITLSGNSGGSMSFRSNKAWDSLVDKPGYSGGGALYADSELTISGNSGMAVTFSGNEAGNGGAASVGYHGTMNISGNGAVTFSGNVAQHGGAVCIGQSSYSGGSVKGWGELQMTGNSNVSFSGNVARSKGGAIYSPDNGLVNISSNAGNVTLSGNSAVLYGGAIRGQYNSTIKIDSNAGSVSLSGNKVIQTGGSPVYGGAISADTDSTTSLSGNGSLSLTGNVVQGDASACGGAVAAWKSTLNIHNNIGGVTLSENSAITTKSTTSAVGAVAAGGACYGKTLSIEGNKGTVQVWGNKAEVVKVGTAKGGAFYVLDTLSIMGNAAVEFRGNMQKTPGETILRSVYVESESAAGALLLSAAAGGTITFYDSLYAGTGTGTTHALSVDFNSGEGDTGTITFSGRYAAEDLLDVKPEAAAAEVAASRTSTVQSSITLHQGTLAVQELATLQSRGLTVKDGATLSLNNGTIEMLAESTLSLSANSVLRAEGSNVLQGGALTFADGSVFDLVLGEENLSQALITLGAGTLEFGTARVNILGLENLTEGEYLLLDISASSDPADRDWTTEGITLVGLGAGDSIHRSDDGTRIYLAHTIIPEPATATLGMLAFCALAARRRRS